MPMKCNINIVYDKSIKMHSEITDSEIRRRYELEIADTITTARPQHLKVCYVYRKYQFYGITKCNVI